VEDLEHYDKKRVMNAQQLEEMAEEDPDFDDDDFMTEYRQQRMA